MRISDWSSDVCSSDLGPQTNTLARAHAEGLDHAAVYRYRFADTAVHAGIHHVAEVFADRGVLQEAPVVENPGDIAIDSDRFGLLDDQRAVKAAADLLEAPLVRVVPEGAGIGHGELVEEGDRKSTRLNSSH